MKTKKIALASAVTALAGILFAVATAIVFLRLSVPAFVEAVADNAAENDPGAAVAAPFGATIAVVAIIAVVFLLLAAYLAFTIFNAVSAFRLHAGKQQKLPLLYALLPVIGEIAAIVAICIIFNLRPVPGGTLAAGIVFCLAIAANMALRACCAVFLLRNKRAVPAEDPAETPPAQ